MSSGAVRYDAEFFSDDDSCLFLAGRHYRLYEKLGAHPREIEGIAGTGFALWAPNAHEVAVAGETDDRQWNYYPLKRRPDASGIWEGFVTDIHEGARYRFSILPEKTEPVLQKTDPFSFFRGNPSGGTSRVINTAYGWGDGEWMKNRSSAGDSCVRDLDI